MKLSALLRLLADSIPVDAFLDGIQPDVAAYVQALRVHGGVVPIKVAEDADVVVSRAGFARLCNLFAAGKLTADELAFVADVMQLSERVTFEDSWIGDAVAECTDPAINGPLTITRARQLAAHAVSEHGAHAQRGPS